MKPEQARTSPPDCVLLDSTGELQNWYAVATIVFVGKSLTARGGQNPVEPILAGKPVLFGPHMENFSALAQALVANGAAIQIQNPNSLQEKIAWLLRDREAALRLVANAQAVVARHSGATAPNGPVCHESRIAGALPGWSDPQITCNAGTGF